MFPVQDSTIQTKQHFSWIEIWVIFFSQKILIKLIKATNSMLGQANIILK